MVLAASGFNPTFLLLGLVGLVISIVAIVDVVKRPDWAWQQSGQNKTLWLILNIVGLFICGLIIGLIYLLAIRPKVAAAQSGGGPTGGGGYGGTPYGGTGQYGSPSSSYGTAPPPPGYGGGTTPYAGAPTPPPPASTPAAPPPGWYPDPAGSGQPRYWNGQSWAEG